MTLQALVLQHQHNAPPALLADWAAQREPELVVVRADRERELSEPDGFGFVVTLGSDHSAGSDRPPWSMASRRARHPDPRLHDRRRTSLSAIEATSATNTAAGGATGRARLERALDRRELREVEVLWSDHQGHARGKRITADGFLERAEGQGFAFCDAVLCWDVAGDVKDGLRFSSWDTGFPDLFAVPDLDSYRRVPWRDGVGQVVCDLVGHDRELVRTAPRTVLRRVLDRLARLGYQAAVGIEIEFHLLKQDGAPFADGVQAYSLQKACELEPLLDSIVGGLTGFVDLEGVNTEDETIIEILGEDAVHDYTKLAQYEWETFVAAVSDWDRERYLTSI
jgi:glutamine synthetase